MGERSILSRRDLVLKELLMLDAKNFMIKAMSEMLNDASKITWRSSKRMIENPFMLIHVW